MLFDYCLAPDTTASGPGIGCDNMTLIIVAITHGRTQKKWYKWIKERVQSRVGHATPSTPPQLYSQSRLSAYRTRQEEARALQVQKKRISDKAQAPKTTALFRFFQAVFWFYCNYFPSPSLKADTN